MNKENGFLSIVAILLIVMIGLLGIAITYLFVGSSASSIHFTQAETALYIAESGLEKATRLLLTPTLTGDNMRLSCAGLNANTNLTNSSFGQGALTVTGSAFYA